MDSDFDFLSLLDKLAYKSFTLEVSSLETGKKRVIKLTTAPKLSGGDVEEYILYLEEGPKKLKEIARKPKREELSDYNLLSSLIERNKI